MLRIIREDEAPSLSRKLTSMGAAATDIAARRQTDPASLRRLVDGDLNSITMKALEKARERRYASVSDLAADIQRHLEHRPVLASPPGRLYRTRKFLRRHRLAALGTAAGVVFLVLSGVTAWSLSHRDSASRPKLTDKDTIVLADFDNKTGDPVFDDTLRQGLSVELQQSPFLEPDFGPAGPADAGSDGTAERCAADSWKSRSKSASEPGAPRFWRARSQALEASMCWACARRTATPETFWTRSRSQAAKREDVLNSLSQIARKFRTRVGESLATVEKHSTPLAEATTTSLEALKAYSTGMKVVVSSGSCRRHTFFPPRCRNRSQIRDGVRGFGAFLQRYGRVRVVGREHHKSLATAGSSQRPGEIFYRLYLRPAGDGKSGKGVPNPRIVVSDLSSRGESKCPGFLSGALPLMEQADMKERSRWPKEESRPIPTWCFGYGSLASSYFFLDRFPEAESIASARALNASWRILIIG